MIKQLSQYEYQCDTIGEYIDVHGMLFPLFEKLQKEHPGKYRAVKCDPYNKYISIIEA